MERLSYFLPILMLVFLFLFKFLIPHNRSFESLKRLIVDFSVDITSLSISFVISYMILIASKIKQAEINYERNNKLNYYWEYFGGSIACISVYLLFLLFVVYLSNFFISKYDQKNKIRYIIFGFIICEGIAVCLLTISIYLLKKI